MVGWDPRSGGEIDSYKLDGAAKVAYEELNSSHTSALVVQTVEMAKRESIDRSLFEETGINPRGED